MTRHRTARRVEAGAVGLTLVSATLIWSPSDRVAGLAMLGVVVFFGAALIARAATQGTTHDR